MRFAARRSDPQEHARSLTARAACIAPTCRYLDRGRLRLSRSMSFAKGGACGSKPAPSIVGRIAYVTIEYILSQKWARARLPVLGS